MKAYIPLNLSDLESKEYSKSFIFPSDDWQLKHQKGKWGELIVAQPSKSKRRQGKMGVGSSKENQNGGKKPKISRVVF